MLKDYGIDFELFEKYEQAARKNFPTDFVSKENVLRLAKEANLPTENYNYLTDFLSFADQELFQFIWLLYYVQFETKEDFMLNYHSIDSWPMPKSAEEKFPGGIGAVVCLLAVENLKKWVKERHLGKDIIEGYYTRYRYFLELNGGNPGIKGMHRLKGFLYAYTKPFFFRLGRLAFEVTKLEKQVECYINEEKERIFAASADGLFNSEGVLDWKEGKPAVYEKNGNILRVQKFNTAGRLEPTPTELDLTKYKLFLSKQDYVVSVHIPEGGRLDEKAVADSFDYAKKIIDKYFPYCKAFVCHTWFIDPILVDDGVVKKGGNMENLPICLIKQAL